MPFRVGASIPLEVRSALRAPTPRLRCSAPPTSPRCAGPRPLGAARRRLPLWQRLRCPDEDEDRRTLDACRSRGDGRNDRDGDCSSDVAAAGAVAARTGRVAAKTATVTAKAWAARRRRACAQPRSAGVPARARSALCTSDSPRLSERSSRSERSEFRGGAGAASIAGHPRAAGASTRRAGGGRPAPLPAPTRRAPSHGSSAGAAGRRPAPWGVSRRRGGTT